MSLAYDLYLEQHKGNVAKGFKWIQENLPDLLIPINGVSYEHQICYCHDLSKDDEEEYNAYDAYFYGGNRSYQVVKDFNYAWLHHIHNNPHHWQYWILVRDEGELVPIDMPIEYICEMLCDWSSFHYIDPESTANKWYKDNKKKMILSDDTRKKVEKLLELAPEL